MPDTLLVAAIDGLCRDHWMRVPDTRPTWDMELPRVPAPRLEVGCSDGPPMMPRPVRYHEVGAIRFDFDPGITVRVGLLSRDGDPLTGDAKGYAEALAGAVAVSFLRSTPRPGMMEVRRA